MRPPAILSGQVPNSDQDQGERFRRFVQAVVRVPKVEVEKKKRESGLAKGGAGGKREAIMETTKQYKFGKGKKAPTAIHSKGTDGNHIVGLGNLRVFIVPDGKFWFAQALEIDYAAQGDSVDEAKKNFQEGLAATIDLNLQMYGTIEKLLDVAPSSVLKEASRNREFIKLYWQVSGHELGQRSQPLPFAGIDYYLQETTLGG
jgi:hypothetical protein